MTMRRWLGTQHVVSPAGYGLGYRPNSGRSRWSTPPRPLLSELLKRLGAAVPGAGDTTGLKPYCGTVFNQTRTGSCTAQSSCKALRVTLAARGQMPAGVDDFSPKLFYGTTRQVERAVSTGVGQPLVALADDGAMPDDCIKAAALGVGPLGALVGGVYDDVDATNVNDEVVLTDDEATLLAPGAHDVDLLATDLPAQWAAQIAARVGGTLALFVDTANFMAYDGTAPIQQIDTRDPQGGGHQVKGPVYWYDSPALGRVWGFLNSWGAWGQAGYGEITHTCLMSAIDAALAFDVQLMAGKKVQA